MRAYPTMKKNNPYTPIMLRGAQGTEPRVFARYGMFSYSIGEKKQVFWKREGWLFLVLIGVEFGKEKQESLAGAYFVSVYSVPFNFFFLLT